MRTLPRALSLLVLVLLLAAPTAATASPSTTPRFVDYTHGGTKVGITVHSTADALARLRGAPRSFKVFAGATADKLTATSACADQGYVGVTVEKVRSDGFAVGGVNDCGGYAALWAVVDGSWKQLMGTQDTWACGVLKRHAVPSAVVGDTCFAYHGDHRAHPYHQL